MQYKVHLNLRQRAALRSAISFWKNKEVKDRLREFFTSCEETTISKVEKKWHKLTKAILEEWKKDVLPKKLEVELAHIVQMIGKTIFNWYQYMKHEYEQEETLINYIDKIHWTPYGTVDAVTIFKSFWLDNSNFDISKMYNFSCRYAMEDYINDLWDEIPSDIQNDCYGAGIYGRFDQHIIAYWNCGRDDDLLNLMRYFEESDFSREDMRAFNLIYNVNLSIQEYMLRLSVHQGYYIATKYFWEKLTEEERNENVLKCARISVERYNYYANKNEPIGNYKSSQYVEICIFLMNQMSKIHKKAFFNERIDLYEFDELDDDFPSNVPDVKDDILKMLLSTWPWQELFMPVLKDMLKYQDDRSRMACRFLNAITDQMTEHHALGYAVETCKYKCLLRESWLIIPASIKQKIVEDWLGFNLNNLIDVWDMDSLKLILNDPGITAVRDRFLDFGAESYEAFIVSNQFEKLDEFIDEISRSDEEKKQFKQKMNSWYTFIMDDQLHLVDKLLDWRCSTSEDRQSTKNSINHIQFCEELIEMYDYELLEKFLDWKFDTEEEKKKCKNHFKCDIFSIRRICGIWNNCKKNINKAKKECSEFLNWFLESEEEVVLFKKEMLVKFDTDRNTMFHLAQLKRDGMIDYFILWCLLDDEQFQRVREFKQALSQPNLWPH